MAPEREQAEGGLNFRAGFERVVTQISTGFINLSSEEIDTGINRALQILGEFARIDRSYVFQYYQNRTMMSNTHEWCSRGIEPQMDRLQEIPADLLSWINERIFRGETVRVPRVADLPAEANIVKEECQAQGIQSFVGVPLISGGRCIGALGFDSVQTDRQWSENTISLLNLAGHAIANALERKRAEERIKGLNRLKENLFSGSLAQKLKFITDGVVEIFEADFARIWVMKPGDLCDSGCFHAGVTEGPHVCRHRDRCLCLVASSGRYTHTDGEVHGRVPFGCYKIGRIASGDEPKFLTTDVTHDPRVHDHDWAGELGLVSFAGYRLLSASGGPMGVLALFSKNVISPDEDALLEGLANTAAQVAQTAETEEALRESEEKYRHLVETSQSLIWSVDPQGRWTYLNENATRRIYGYEPGEMIGRRFTDFMTPDQAEKDLAIFEEIKAGRSWLDYETVHLRKDGSPIVMSFNAIVRCDERGEVLGTTGTASDITARKHAEEALREAHSIINRGPAVAFLSRNDEGWPVEFVSANVQELSGYMVEEFTSGEVTYAQVIHPEDLSRVAGEMRSFIQEQGGANFAHEPYRIVTGDGEVKWVDASTHIRRDEQGAVTHFQGILEDITRAKSIQDERARLERTLQQAQKMESLGTLAGGIAHDINNILQAIFGCMELAFPHVAEDSPVRRILMEILDASHRAKELVEQILAFSRQVEVELQPVQISAIVNEAIKLLRASLPTTIEIRVRLEAETSYVRADATQIYQVLMNLCTNAAHAMRAEGGVLEIGLTETRLEKTVDSLHANLDPGPYVRLTVSDAGDGMAPDVMERVFDPYFSTKEKEEGTGLGLAMVHGIVRSHGGGIIMESALGEGSTFHVLLPSQIQPESLAEAEGIESPSDGTECLLFVDDEEVLTRVAQGVLGEMGYEVVATTSSLEALALFQETPERFDLVITDQTMPKMTGLVLAAELMRSRPDIPVVLCSGLNDVSTIDQAGVTGIRAFLKKPFSMREMAGTIRGILDGPP